MEPIAPTLTFKLNRAKEVNPALWKEALRKPVPFTKQRIEEFKGEHVKSNKVKNMKRTETGLQGRVFVNQQDIKTKKNKFGADGIKHGRKDDFKRKKEDKN